MRTQTEKQKAPLLRRAQCVRRA